MKALLAKRISAVFPQPFQSCSIFPINPSAFAASVLCARTFRAQQRFPGLIMCDPVRNRAFICVFADITDQHPLSPMKISKSAAAFLTQKIILSELPAVQLRFSLPEHFSTV